jgi:hypothetical protein
MSLVVRVDFEQRAELLAGEPDVYYITDHYEDYPAALIRLARIAPYMLPICSAWHTGSFCAGARAPQSGNAPRRRDHAPGSSEDSVAERVSPGRNSVCRPGWEPMEFICEENNTDRPHLPAQ